MSSYIVAHYNGTSTAFTSVGSLDQACTMALAISNYQPNNRRGIISVIDVARDKMVYYGRYQQIQAQLNASSGNAALPWLSCLRSFVHALRLKLPGFTLG